MQRYSPRGLRDGKIKSGVWRGKVHLGFRCWKDHSPVLSFLSLNGASTLLTRSASPEMCNLSLRDSVSRKASANPALCPSDQSLPLYPLPIRLWERDPPPPLLSRFHPWTVLCLRGDTILWIIKWNAGPACAAEVGEAESIYSSWETAQMYLFSFFAWEIWTLHFLLHEKTPHNDYFGGSFPIRSGLSFFSFWVYTEVWTKSV